MDHPYSFWADVLSKYQGSPPWIQALWLVLLAAVALGVVWCLTDFAKHAVAAFRRTRTRGKLVYGLVQDEQGRWLVCLEGEARRVEGAAARGAGSIAAARDDPFATPILPPRR